uniref:Pheromone n=1 Tax=Lentinula edodes TaxID=5353 RepID=A0A2U9Q1H1_LENED|nr:Pheromone [Lentinula edodes]AWT58064.1 Pheromone [Lentinula edodes]
MDDFNTLNTMFPTTTSIVDSSGNRSLTLLSDNTQCSPAPSVPVDSEAVGSGDIIGFCVIS